MCFLAISFLIKVVSLTNLDEFSVLNPKTIQNTPKETLNVELELDTEIIFNITGWNNHSAFLSYHRDLIAAFESSLVFNLQLQNLIEKNINAEKNDKQSEQLSDILQFLISSVVYLKKKISKVKYKIDRGGDANNELCLKILQYLEINKIQKTALPGSCKRTIVNVQELLLFIVKTIIEYYEIKYIDCDLTRPEDIPNEFICNFLKSNEDIILLQKIQSSFKELIAKTSNYTEKITEIQQNLENLLLRFNVKVLNPEFLNQQTFVNNTIRSDNSIRATFESKFIEKHQNDGFNPLIFVIPLQFILKDGVMENTITIRVPIFSK